MIFILSGFNLLKGIISLGVGADAEADSIYVITQNLFSHSFVVHNRACIFRTLHMVTSCLETYIFFLF